MIVAVPGYARSMPHTVPQDVAVVTVSRGASGPTIQPGFLGLSLENTAIIPYAGSDPKAPDPVFLQLIRNLTPGQSPQLRIGGDSTDWAWYPVPGLAKPHGIRVTLTPRWLAVMHAVAADLNARLIMGVDLEADSHAVADGEASAFERQIGKPYIEALELGNEPNLYGSFTWYVLPDGVHVMGRPPATASRRSSTISARSGRACRGRWQARPPALQRGWLTPASSSPPSRASAW